MFFLEIVIEKILGGLALDGGNNIMGGPSR